MTTYISIIFGLQFRKKKSLANASFSATFPWNFAVLWWVAKIYISQLVM